PRRLRGLSFAAGAHAAGRGAALWLVFRSHRVGVRPPLPVGFQAYRSDLARVGERYSDEWHRIHLRDPRLVVPESNMPSYPWLQHALLDGQNVQDRMRALRKLGVPYADAQIQAAPQEIAGKTEEDALVAYLQGLGVGLRKARQAEAEQARQAAGHGAAAAQGN